MRNSSDYAVVLNTSSLWSFLETQTFELLAGFFSTIIIPPSVKSEIVAEFGVPNNIKVQELSPRQRKNAQAVGLGAGESEAMILARDMKLPLIIDDGEAQTFADEQLGIEVYGSLEFLRAAFLSCAIERDEFINDVLSFSRYERANLDQISWASRAEK